MGDGTPGDGGLATMTRRSALFAVGAVAGKVVGLIMLPVLTRLLTPTELGNLDVLMVLVNALIAGLMLGLDVAALRLYFDERTTAGQRTLLATWFVIALAVTSTAGLVLVLFSGSISSMLFASDRLQPAVGAAALAIVAGTVNAIILTILRARGRAGWYVAVSLGTLTAYALLATFLLVAWRADAAAVLVGWSIALVGSAVLGSAMLRADLLHPPSVRAARALLRLGLPLAPAVVGTLVSELLLRILLLRIAGPEEVAFFTVGNRFASVAALSLAVLQLAWVPRAYALGAAIETRPRVGAEGTWIVAIVCAAVLVVAAGAREIVAIAAGPTYLAALPAMGFGLVAVVGAAAFLVISMPSAIGRRTEDLAVATGAAAVVGVVGTFLLAEAWGAAGAAASLAAGQWVAVLIVAMLSPRRAAIALQRLRLGVMVGVSSAAVLVLVTDLPLPARGLVAVVAIAVVAASVVRRDSAATLRSIVRR